jgi:hypothetical protein
MIGKCTHKPENLTAEYTLKPMSPPIVELRSIRCTCGQHWECIPIKIQPAPAVEIVGVKNDN